MRSIKQISWKIRLNNITVGWKKLSSLRLSRLSSPRLTDDKILMANDNAVKLFGLMPNELERYRLRDFFADSDNRQLLTERLEKETEVHDFEILAKAINGETPFWLLTSANVIDYNYDIAIYSSFQDITTRKTGRIC